MRVDVLCGFLVLALPAGSFAQDPLPPCATVRITAPTHFDGLALGVVRSGVVQVGAIAVPLVDVTRLDCWTGRKSSAATGALVGGALGAFLGVASAIVACQEESIISCEGAGALLALGGSAMGALLGASVGALIHHDTWEEVPLDQVRVGLRLLRDGVGLGANIAF